MSIIFTEQIELTTPLEEIYGGIGNNTYNTGDIIYSSATDTLSRILNSVIQCRPDISNITLTTGSSSNTSLTTQPETYWVNGYM